MAYEGEGQDVDMTHTSEWGLHDIADGQGTMDSILGVRLVHDKVLEECGPSDMQEVVKEVSSGLLQLVNIPLQFTSEGLTTISGGHQHGRPPGPATWGGPGRDAAVFN
ncbi:UNVERIFIED_CONTAM: hypothetical protein Slati_0879500 [Sesamum latifolium]|uniref:Uncharacterized protein n=1 Tax=Sesamum latifolium TaxID=2727402 RepID=A0AAW2XNE7_9LAMI